MRLKLLLLLCTIFTGCKKADNETALPVEDIVTKPEQVLAPAPDTVYAPALPIAEKQGMFFANGDSLQIIKLYTNDVAYTQLVGENDESVMLYRDAVVALVNSKGDTIKVSKQDFKDHIAEQDYAVMILQGVNTDISTKKGKVPLMVWLCMPDSDLCYHFNVKVAGKKITIMEVDEDDL
jgi:hypothetical protein